MQKQPLRFILLCDSLELEFWQARSIQEALAGGVAEIVGVVIREATPLPDSVGRWSRRWRNRKLILWRLFDRFYARRQSRAIRRVDMSDALADAPRCHDTPVKIGRFAEALSAESIQFVQSLSPDVVLRFSYGILRGEILKSAKFGVWSFHHGDPAKYRGQPPGFWEIAEGSPIVGSILQVLGDELDGGRILWQGFFQTRRSSYVKTRDAMYLGSAPWLKSVCSHVVLTGKLPDPASSGEKGSIYRRPENGAMIRFLGKTIRSFVESQITYRLHRQDWNCGVTTAPIADVAGLNGAERQADALQQVQWMQPPQGKFYADPFGFEMADGSGVRVFFENLDWKRNLGEIATTIFSKGKFGEVHRVLSAQTHLSYPYVMMVDGRPFFVPEHSAAHDVSRFSIDEAGRAAVKTTMMPQMPLIDTTFVEWKGKMWAFATIDTATTNADLFVFYADDLDGPWLAHPLNPVKTDVRSARPAGTPFVVDGNLYRPAQDCSTHYGSAVTINEILKLSESEFEERVIHRVEPRKGGGYDYGLHTISQVGGLTLIDGARKRLALI